ncbi:MAG TPA: glycoside hydrolase family 31 protein [Sphingomicrobium sp.]|nr:glycoside hydrolase family 31 protein [Sphingomicrobium sp.]
MELKRLSALALTLTMVLAPSMARAAEPTSAAVSANSLEIRSDGVDVRSGRVLVRITALTPDIIRVRVARDGILPEDSSWAVLASMRAAHVPVTPIQGGFATAAVRVHVDPATLALTITDLGGKVILADSADPVSLDGRAFTLRKVLPLGEHIYGLGDKTGGVLDRRGKTYVDWNTDAYRFDSSTDPIYKSIPFFIGVGGAGGSYGLLLDNTWRTWFDFGHRDADTLAMGGPDGPIDYYVIAGPTTREVVRRYTDLTGKAPLPPEWALGYQQSRYSYMSAAEVRDVAKTLRSDRIPTDVMWLDIDFQDRNRPFTIDAKTYPDLKKLTADLAAEGIKLIAITDLHIADAPNQGYAPYDTGIAGNDFVHNPDGSVYVGKVWPGPSVFPDFTDKRARAWWATNFTQLADAGIAGFWNDMDEPSVFNETGTMPLDVVHRIDSDDFAPREATHAEIHNVYGMENSRATYDAAKSLRPNEREFVMTRATYAGGQRYAVTWTGDDSSTWDHLRLSVHQLINLGLSGFAYAGADVGGFTGGPSPDLMTRWFEIGAFTPIFRDHSEKGSPRAEPWLDGPTHLAIRRRFVEERYRLMPYFYALADENSRTGDPLMRPVFYDYPDALDAACNQTMDFTLGASLLIAPPPQMESPEPYQICLPAGGWYDYWTGEAVNSSTITVTPELDSLPVFVRAGTILPRQPLVASTSQIPDGPLSLDVYPGPDCGGSIYFDDGHTTAFTRGEYLRQSIRCAGTSGGGLQIAFKPRAGRYAAWWKEIQITVHGEAKPMRISDASHQLQAEFDKATNSIRFQVADLPAGGEITLAPR